MTLTTGNELILILPPIGKLSVLFCQLSSLFACLKRVCALSGRLAMEQLLKGLCHGQKCIHLFSDSEPYHKQMSPIPSSNGSLDIPLPMRILRALSDALFRPLAQQNWP